MKRILTVDWDYLINASADVRAFCFPDAPNEKYNQELQSIIWSTRYSSPSFGEFPKLIDIGVLDCVEPLADFIRNILNYCDTKLLVSDSHKFMYDVVHEHITNFGETFELINMDFHHDLYNYRTSGEAVNCGNWCTVLHEEYPNMKYIWIAHKDSEREVIGGGQITEMYPDMKVTESFDTLTENLTPEKLEEYFKSFEAVHICRSSMWSPPHLDYKFNEFIQRCVSPYKTEEQVTVIEDYVSQQRDFDANLLTGWKE